MYIDKPMQGHGLMQANGVHGYRDQLAVADGAGG